MRWANAKAKTKEGRRKERAISPLLIQPKRIPGHLSLFYSGAAAAVMAAALVFFRGHLKSVAASTYGHIAS